MKMLTLTEELLNIGMNEQEAAVYLATLQLGKSSLVEIARKAKLNRTTLYPCIERMVSNRWLVTTLSGKRTLYSACPPDVLQKFFNEKLARFAAALPELSLLARNTKRKPEVSFYEGIEGIKAAYRASAACIEKRIYAFVGAERLNVKSKTLQTFWDTEYLKLRLKNDVQGKIIVPDNADGKALRAKDKAAHRETRMVPESTYNFGAEVLIYDNTVLFISYSEHEEFVLSLKSPSIATTMRMIWQIAWTTAY